MKKVGRNKMVEHKRLQERYLKDLGVDYASNERQWRVSSQTKPLSGKERMNMWAARLKSQRSAGETSKDCGMQIGSENCLTASEGRRRLPGCLLDSSQEEGGVAKRKQDAASEMQKHANTSTHEHYPKPESRNSLTRSTQQHRALHLEPVKSKLHDEHADLTWYECM